MQIYDLCHPCVLTKYIRVSNRSHKQSLIVARYRQILFKCDKISRGVFIFTKSSKEMSFSFSTGQKVGDNDFLGGKKMKIPSEI